MKYNIPKNEKLVCDSIMKNLIICKKAGLSMLVTGNVNTEIKLDLLKKLIVSDKDKRTIYIEREKELEIASNVELKHITIEKINEVEKAETITNSDEMKKTINPILKLRPNTVFYPELYGEDIFDMISVSATGYQLLTSIVASNETIALKRIATYCLKEKEDFPIPYLNYYFDLIINIGKYSSDEQNLYKIFSISVPEIEGEKIEAKKIVEYDCNKKKWILKNDIPELKENVLRRTGMELESWI